MEGKFLMKKNFFFIPIACLALLSSGCKAILKNLLENTSDKNSEIIYELDKKEICSNINGLNTENEYRSSRTYSKRVYQEDYFELISILTNKIKKNPKNASLYHDRGLAKYCVDEHYFDGDDDWLKSIEINPKFYKSYAALGSLTRFPDSQNINYLNKFIKFKPKESNAYLNRAIAILFTGEWNKEKLALNDLDESIKLDPKNYEALVKRAELRNDQSIYDGAVEDLTKAIEIMPSYLTDFWKVAHYDDLSKFKFRNKDYYGSINDCSKAIKFNKGKPYHCLEESAKSYQKINQYTNAINDISKHISFLKSINFPNRVLSENYMYRAELKSKVFNISDLSALEDYDRGVELNPTYSNYNIRAEFKLRIKEYQKALDDLNKSISISSAIEGRGDELNGEAYLKRGFLKNKFLGDTKGACLDWENSKRIFNIYDFSDYQQDEKNEVESYLKKFCN
mgnify:CR=1 FL=1